MFVIKIDNPFGEKITKIFKISNLRIKHRLNEISTANFELSLLDLNATYKNFTEFNKISIYKVKNGGDILLFDGVLRDIETDLSIVKIELNDNLYLLNKKKNFGEKIYTNKTIDFILQDQLDEINARKDTGIILDCGITEIIPEKKYEDGKKFLDILKDLSNYGYEFILKDNILYFKESIGIDRTSGNNFVQFSFDRLNVESKTIDNATSSYNSDNIANSITVKDDGNLEDTTSINKFGAIEEHFTSGTKEVILEERKNSTRELSVIPSDNNFAIADIGDLVKVYIDSGSDLLFYDGNLKIVEKEFIAGDLDKVNIKLSTTKIKTLGLLEKLLEINTKVNNLELK